MAASPEPAGDMPEISDLIVSFDPVTLLRAPVEKKRVVDRFLALGNQTAARIVAELPESAGVLDAAAMDQLLITVHCEMQRLSEEFVHGPRVRELLAVMCQTLRDGGAPPPYRLVDVGCGTGFVIRWLAAHGNFGPDVELMGMDFNPALVGEAIRLARIEELKCQFLVGNAFRMEKPGSIYLSTGVLHHFRDDGLRQLFSEHDRPGVQGFMHYDFQPSPFAPMGSWLFHLVRMSQPLARHDGVVSAIRAHTAQVLTSAARTGAPGFRSGIYGARWFSALPLPRVFHAVLGLRPELVGHFREALGPRKDRLGTLE